ncbi:MAG: hypothetical protein ACREJU_06200 [Nitrospiraceae bacterium]
MMPSTMRKPRSKRVRKRPWRAAAAAHVVRAISLVSIHAGWAAFAWRQTIASEWRRTGARGSASRAAAFGRSGIGAGERGRLYGLSMRPDAG